jgi:hypothetical protein
VLTLSENERRRHGLRVGRDVVACVTSLKPLRNRETSLTLRLFCDRYRDSDEKCWLPRTDRLPSSRLKSYFDQVSLADRRTATCTQRQIWWKFSMPTIPSVFVASGFRCEGPKVVRNLVNAVAIGSVTGIYGISRKQAISLVDYLRSRDLSDQIVAHSNGLRKLEIGQLRTLTERWHGSLSKPSPS